MLKNVVFLSDMQRWEQQLIINIFNDGEYTEKVPGSKLPEYLTTIYTTNTGTAG